MPFLRNKIVKIITIVIVSCAVLSGMAYFGNNPVQRALYTVISPVFNAAYGIVTPVRKFVTNIKESGNYEKEIKSLKEQVNALSIENKTREDYINENKRLKELLDLKDNTMAAYNTITARVVSYEPNSWYDTVMLGKGTKDGISVDDIVITSLGVVGRVTDCGGNWSKVSTIINSANSVGVKLSRTGDVGVLSGDASLAQDKNAKLEYLSNDKNLIKGDILVTSGLGGVYPADLIIGKIINIKSDSAGNLDYGVVEPSVDFSSLYEVLVITDMKEGYVKADEPLVINADNNDEEVLGEQITE
ncbi:MAG: rod shape-determining protein MreC [Clostridia bacterium]|nr:rod shape-determining protein MreC [Clostridia bacterium]